MTYKVRHLFNDFSLFTNIPNNNSVNKLNCIQHLPHNEIKYQGEAIPILCAMGTHGQQPEVEFSNFLAQQSSNAVSQMLDSN